MSLMSTQMNPTMLVANPKNATPKLAMNPTVEATVGHALVTGRSPRGMCGDKFAQHVSSFDWEKRWAVRLGTFMDNLKKEMAKDRQILHMAYRSTDDAHSREILDRLVMSSKTIQGCI